MRGPRRYPAVDGSAAAIEWKLKAAITIPKPSHDRDLDRCAILPSPEAPQSTINGAQVWDETWIRSRAMARSHLESEL